MTFKEFLNELEKIKSEYNDDTLGNLNIKYLTFYIKDEIFAIDISYIEEIMEFNQLIHSYDNKNEDFINYKNKISNIIDLRVDFKNSEEIGYNTYTTMIILDNKNDYTGLIVDEVIEIISIPSKEITITSNKKETSIREIIINGYFKKDKELIKILDVDKVYYTAFYINNILFKNNDTDKK